MSRIEWTDTTWNPTTGCTKVSAGCKNCYAQKTTNDLQKQGMKKYMDGFDIVRTHAYTLAQPGRLKNSHLIFVNSMSDPFHPHVPLSFIKQIFEVMNNNQQHTFQVLTKRPERLLEVQEQLNWTPNIWMGVSVENEDVTGRIDLLRQTDAQLKFLSIEPLIGPIPALNLDGIDWVIVGGESGRGARAMQVEWVEDIQQQCTNAGVAFFFKQWGGENKKLTGRLLHGRTYDKMPAVKDRKIA